MKCYNCNNEVIDKRKGLQISNPKKYCSPDCKDIYQKHHTLTPLKKPLPIDYQPKMGEIRTGTELKLIKDYKINPSARYQWGECVICKNPKWFELRKGRKSFVCKYCIGSYYLSGTKAPWYKGGTITKYGYRLITLDLYTQSDTFWLPMANKRRAVMEHRLIMAKHLGRCLSNYEIVHHKNGDKLDNRIANLELTTKGSHSISHSRGYRHGYRQGFNDGINARIDDLKHQIKMLQWQIRDAAENKNALL